MNITSAHSSLIVQNNPENQLPDDVKGSGKQFKGLRKVSESIIDHPVVPGKLAFRGKPFTEMSIPERFVLFLSVLAPALKVVGSASPNTMCRDNNRCSSPSSHKLTPPDVCLPPNILEQIGPEHSMRDYPLKPSDAMPATFGIEQREILEVPKKFRKQQLPLDSIRKMHDFQKEIAKYLKKHCGEVYFTRYAPDFGKFYNSCIQYRPSDCQSKLHSGLTHYDNVRKEYLALLSQGYDDDNLSNDLSDLNEAHIDYVAKYYYSLMQSVMNYCEYAEQALSELKDTPSTIRHLEVIQSLKKKTLHFHEQTYVQAGFKNWESQCRQRAKLQKSCYEKQNMEELQQTAARLKNKRIKRKKTFEQSIGYKFFSFSANLVMSMVVATFSIPLFCINGIKHSRRYYQKRKKIPLETIIKNMEIAPIEDFEKNINKFEQCSDNRHRKNAPNPQGEGLILPNCWDIPRLTAYNEVHAKPNKVKRATKNDSILQKIKEKITPSTIVKIPDYPWANDSIPFVHEKIKPIYHYSQNKVGKDKPITAYAYLDESRLTKKFDEKDIKKIRKIFEDGRRASSAHGAAGYKVFKHKNQLIWEFKLAGKNRLYGTPVETNKEGRKAGVAPLVVFDITFRKKLGGNH